MALQLEEVGEERAEEFNRVVQQSPQVDFLQSWEWGEIKRATGWRPRRWLIRDPQGVYRGAASILTKRLPFLGRSFLYVPRGPACRYPDPEVFPFLTDQVRELAREERAIFVKIDPDVPKPGTKVTSHLGELGYVPARFRPHWGGVQPVAVCRLALAGSPEDVFSRFKPKTRYNIRLAQRKGVTVSPARRDDVPVFHRIWQETAERQGFGIRGLDHLLAVWDHLVEKGHAVFLLARYQGEPLAGVGAVAFGPKAWYLYGGTRSLHRETMPMYLTQWAAIRWAMQKGCQVYDFLGVSCHMDPQDPLYGLYRFKSGFSPEYTEFIGEFDLPIESYLYRAWNAAEPLYLRTMRRVNRARQAVFRALEAATDGGLGPM